MMPAVAKKVPMVDLHCHILPGVDDGPATLDDALAMARFCATDGVTHIFATPHCHRYIHMLRSDILPRVTSLNEELQTANVPLSVLPGSEIQVTDTKEYQREFEADLYCHLGDGKSFTLLEFNWDKSLFPPDATDLIHWIRNQGMTPIIAHPERYNYFWAEPDLLRSIVDAGAWVQVTVDSLIGNHGPGPQVSSEAILRKFPDAVLSSDAHTMARCSGLAAGYAWVERHLGNDRCEDLRDRANHILSIHVEGPTPVAASAVSPASA
jgi:protein-tyrosine phosphatase